MSRDVADGVQNFLVARHLRDMLSLTLILLIRLMRIIFERSFLFACRLLWSQRLTGTLCRNKFSGEILPVTITTNRLMKTNIIHVQVQMQRRNILRGAVCLNAYIACGKSMSEKVLE